MTILAQHEERVILIQPYTEEWSKAVGEFNRRGRPANALFQLPETPARLWLSKQGDQKTYQEVFLGPPAGTIRSLANPPTSVPTHYKSALTMLGELAASYNTSSPHERGI